MRDTPIEAMQKYVHGLTWPVNKDEIIRTLERNGAPEDVLQVIRAMDKPRFTSPSEVHNALWKGA